MAANDPMRIVTNAAKTSAALRFGASAIAGRLLVTTRKYGGLLQTQVKANASGRPGPRVQTGDYRRRIGLRVSGGRASASLARGGSPTAISVSATVGTNAPQGRRLENGFMGMTDSLGRLFHQPPYPHFAPALAKVAPKFEAAVRKDVDAVITAVRTVDRAVGGR